MKEIKESRIIEEVKGYEASDGTFFKDANECKKYEESARAIITARAKEYRVYDGTCDDLYYDFSSENKLEIYDIVDADAAKAVAQYMYEKSDNYREINIDKYIGEKFIVCWSYDEDYCWWYTISELMGEINANYTKMITPKTKEKK